MELKWKLHEYNFSYSQGAGTHKIMDVHRGTLVTHVAARVGEAFAGGDAIVIGDGNNDTGFGAVTHGSTQLENLNGVYIATKDTADGSGTPTTGKLYTTDDTIDLKYTTANSPSAGLMTVYIVYAEVE